MPGELVVWRDGAVVGRLAELRGRLSFAYEPAARPISVSMPVRASASRDRTVRPWFRGLLPEGQIRLMIAYDAGVPADDDFGLLAVLGRDCAGALSLLPPGESPDEGGAGPLLTEPEIAARLRALPTSPMGFDAGFRVSLPGNEHKLLLTRTADGWRRPDRAASTHILKPAIAGLGASTVANEAYCQWLARGAGLPAASTAIAGFDGVEVLLSERYDRAPAPDGYVRRLHQEDGCQALAIDPRDKYQRGGRGPSLRAIARALAGNGGRPAELLRVAVFTVVIGNADWHGKNVSFLFADDDRVSVAPVYDAMSTRFYATTFDGRPVERTLGMAIGGETDIDAVTLDHLVAEAQFWGISAGRAQQIIDDTMQSLDTAVAETDAPIEQLRDLVAARLAHLRRG